jgi:hypothetical protein
MNAGTFSEEQFAGKRLITILADLSVFVQNMKESFLSVYFCMAL